MLTPHLRRVTEVVRTASFANHTPGGTAGVWLSSFLGEAATPVDGKVSQEVPATAGETYDFSGWALQQTNYSAALTFMEMSFLDGSDAVIGSPLLLDLSTDGQTNDGQWLQHMISGTAPAGTASILVSAGMEGGIANHWAAIGILRRSCTQYCFGWNSWRFRSRWRCGWQRLPRLAARGIAVTFSASDLAAWQGGYGAPLAASVGAVPEPTSATGILMGLAALGLLRRRK